MKYYKEAGVNPLASCLPLLLQMPVFISLVYMLRKDLKQHICGAGARRRHRHRHERPRSQSADCNKLVPALGELPLRHDITSKATGVVLIVLMVLYVGIDGRRRA